MKTDYLLLLKKFKKYRILVVGDFIQDVYLLGSCTRLAPEASVPVIDVHTRSSCLGGAANAAANLSAMGAKVSFCTVIGNDAAALESVQMLRAAGVSTENIVKEEQRRTIVKTRVSAPSHTLVRFDEGTDTDLNTAAETRFIHQLHQAYFDCDAVLIADYDKGLLTATVISELKKLKLIEDKFIAVDSKRAAVFAQLSPSLIKPNYEEAIKLLSLPHSHESRVEQLKPYGAHFFGKTNAALIALTIDEDGALFYQNGKFVHRAMAVRVKDPRVSGAGDTFISALLLSILSGASVSEGAEIATTASGISISKTETAVCTAHELLDRLSDGDKQIHLSVQLKEKCRQLRAEGKRIVFTNGCFDILHSGHVSYLRQAREMGDVLIVGLNNDESVRRLKGKERPINQLENRMEVLSALECVDYIVPFGSQRDDTPIGLIKLIHPDLFVKGGDYTNKNLPEERLLKRIGCKIVFLPFVYNQSTTQIIGRVMQQAPLKIAIAN
jgi:D-beta-D-heptose 7-phosphate kinase/D-beta-D-heptose 1-phosphate adenosyltransferase